MVYPAERRVLWHPRHASRFAVGGPGSGNITIYEYSEGHPSIQHVTSHDEMPYMRVRLPCRGSRERSFKGRDSAFSSASLGRPTLHMTT
jgi:hypothetical protein